MIPVTVAEAAAASSARLSMPEAADRPILAVTADSRAVTPGALFVALLGTRVDGHDFLAAARERGAVAALTSRAVEGTPSLVVPDPLAALGRLARHVVDRAAAGGLTVVGITGSQGKTSTKDLLGQVLSAAGPTVAPAGNLNNELGLPLTVCQVRSETRFLVAEMGARGLGHVAYLCRICPPRIGVVLNVGHAHVGEFGGLEATARAKSELVRALPADGVAVLNADDPRVWEMRAATSARTIAFAAAGEPLWPDAVWATDVEGDALGRWRFSLHRKRDGRADRPVRVGLSLTGRHQVANALAAAAAGSALGLETADLAAALQSARPLSRWRMELTERGDGVLVVNDAYNANPESMRSAVETVAAMAAARGTGPAGMTRPTRSTRRSWAVLGDMLELGEVAQEEHHRVGRRVAELGFARLVAVGRWADVMTSGAIAGGMAATEVRAVPDARAAVDVVAADLQPGDVVLIKASRGLALDTAAAALLALQTGDEPLEHVAKGIQAVQGE